MPTETTTFEFKAEGLDRIVAAVKMLAGADGVKGVQNSFTEATEVIDRSASKAVKSLQRVENSYAAIVRRAKEAKAAIRAANTASANTLVGSGGGRPVVGPRRSGSEAASGGSQLDMLGGAGDARAAFQAELAAARQRKQLRLQESAGEASALAKRSEAERASFLRSARLRKNLIGRAVVEVAANEKKSLAEIAKSERDNLLRRARLRKDILGRANAEVMANEKKALAQQSRAERENLLRVARFRKDIISRANSEIRANEKRALAQQERAERESLLRRARLRRSIRRTFAQRDAADAIAGNRANELRAQAEASRRSKMGVLRQNIQRRAEEQFAAVRGPREAFARRGRDPFGLGAIGAQINRPFAAIERSSARLQKRMGRIFQPLIDSTQSARRALAGVSRAFLGVGRFGVRALGFVRRAFRTLGTAIRRAFQNLVSFRGLFLVFIAANAVRGVAEYADSWLNAANRIRAVSNNLADVGRIQEELFQIAQRTRTPLESVVELYSRLALGVGGEFRTDQLNQIVETVSQLAIIGGGTPQSIQGALIQLSQILGAGGAARGIGQELRSIREQTPALFQGIAKGLGLTTGELEKLAEQGKITAEGVAQSLLNVADEAAERFRNINLTIGQGVTRLSNAATKFFGIVGERTGAVTAIVNLLSDAAERLEQSAVAIGDTIRRSVQVARVALLGTSSGASQEQVDAAVVAYAGILGEIDNLARQFASAFGRLFLNLMEIGGRLLGTTFVAVFDTSIKQSIADVFRNVPGFAKVADAIAPDRTTIQTRILDIAPEERSLEQRLQRLQGSLGSASDTIVSRKFGGGASPADILRAQIASTKNQIKALQDERFELEQVLDQVPTQQERTDAAIARSQQDLADATNRFVNTFAEFKTNAKLAFDNIEATATEGAKAIGAEVGNAAVRVEDLLAPYRRILSRAKMGLGPEAEFRMVPQFTRSKSVFDDFGGGQPQEQRLSAIKAATNQYERLGKEINIVSTETQILRLTEDKSQKAKEDLVASLQQQVELLKEQKTVAERLAELEGNSPDSRLRVREIELRIAQIDAAKLSAERAAGIDRRPFGQAFGESLREQVVQFDQLGELGDAAGSRIATAFGDGVTGALRDAITGAKNLEDAFRELASSLLLDLGQMIAKMAIFNAISGGFGSSAGGGSFFGLNLFSGLNPIPSANGNAFYGGQLMAFANGGIVNRPTVFPMANGAGIMGEAGPEAVLPLDRDSEGKLGVRSQGGGVQVLPVVFLDDRSQMEKLTDSEAFQDGLNRARRRRGDR